MGRNRRPSDREIFILAFLLEHQHKQFYGLEIGEATQTSAGALYPILKRLELKEWIEGEWEEIDESEVGRRRRKYYKLTPKGVPAARQAVQKHFAPLKALGGLQT